MTTKDEDEEKTKRVANSQIELQIQMEFNV